MIPSVAQRLTHSRGSINALALGGRSKASPKGRFHCTGGPCWKIYLETGLPLSFTSPLGSQVTISYMTLDKSLPFLRRAVSSVYKIKD